MLGQRLCSYTCLNEASYVSPQSPSWIRLSGSLENNNFQQGTQVKIKILLVQGRHYEMPTNTKKWKVFLSTMVERKWLKGTPSHHTAAQPCLRELPRKRKTEPWHPETPVLHSRWCLWMKGYQGPCSEKLYSSVTICQFSATAWHIVDHPLLKIKEQQQQNKNSLSSSLTLLFSIIISGRRVLSHSLKSLFHWYKKKSWINGRWILGM